MQTQRFNIDPKNFRNHELEVPAEILREGGLVGLPTETVYGIAARADLKPAIELLDKVKNRPTGKQYTIHIADPFEAEEFIENIPFHAANLIKKYWPGPLTLIFDLPGSTSIGLRCPQHPVAQELIRQAKGPIIAPSANLSGQEPAVSADEVLETFDSKINAVIDSGPAALRESSTVVRITESSFELLREGIISAEMIERTARPKDILFVCTGNSCRSPMAEAICKSMLSKKLDVPVNELEKNGYHIHSAGVAAFGGGSASENAIEAMSTAGLDITKHQSRHLTAEMINDADLILAMSGSHLYHVNDVDPANKKAFVISESGVGDPIGGPLETYLNCAHQIEKAIHHEWLERIQKL